MRLVDGRRDFLVLGFVLVGFLILFMLFSYYGAIITARVGGFGDSGIGDEGSTEAPGRGGLGAGGDGDSDPEESGGLPPTVPGGGGGDGSSGDDGGNETFSQDSEEQTSPINRKRPFEGGIPQRVELISVDEFLFAKNSLGSADCGERTCKVIEECGRVTDTQFTLSSGSRIVSGNYEKQLCKYEFCESVVEYELCPFQEEEVEINSSGTYFAIEQVPAESEGVTEDSGQGGAGQGTEEKIVDIRDTQFKVIKRDFKGQEIQLAEVKLRTDSRQLFVVLGDSPIGAQCSNGVKDGFEEGVDCGFNCNKACGENRNLISFTRGILWGLAVLMFVFLFRDFRQKF